MPIQAPQWTDYLNCPVCCREFGGAPRCPISLRCGHTLCRHCLKHLHRKQCPFDQTVIQVEPDELVVNTALLQLAGHAPPAQPYHPPCIQSLPENDRQAYDVIVQCMEHLAVYLKYCGNSNSSMAGSCLSRPMQRKLVTLLQCAITDEEGRGRAVRAVRSLGERTVTELILQHQNPHQLSANLWAAVRARGCQFLGPAMQEEVLKLVLLALEDGSALSRKVLVMFVVQRLEPHFPQASKTSIGHVVQLLYRASCFKVSKRECDSSLMQLKEEFRTYETLRREHDAQIVQIATEAGLRIAPDQWSALLYGDTAHKSHMQSIIDKLQTPQSFSLSVQELCIALQRTGDQTELVVMSMHLECLANIDASPDAKIPSWQHLAEVMTSLKEVVTRLIHYLQQQATGRDTNYNQKQTPPETCSEPSTSQVSPQTADSTPTHNKYKVSMCRDANVRSFCPRGNMCTFAHSEEELERFRMQTVTNQSATNGNYAYVVSMQPMSTMQPSSTSMPQSAMPPRMSVPPPPSSSMPPPTSQSMPPLSSLSMPPPPCSSIPQSAMPLGLTLPPGMTMSQMPMRPMSLPPPAVPMMYPRFSVPPPCLPHIDNYNFPPNLTIRPPNLNPTETLHPNYSSSNNIRNTNFAAPVLPHQPQLGLNQNGLAVPMPEPPYFDHYVNSSNNIQYHQPVYTSHVFPGPVNRSIPNYQVQEQSMPPQIPPNIFVPVSTNPQRNISPYLFDDQLRPLGRFSPAPLDRHSEPIWTPTYEMFNGSEYGRTVGPDWLTYMREALRGAAGIVDFPNGAEDKELEEGLQALERRIDTEFKNTD